MLHLVIVSSLLLAPVGVTFGHGGLTTKLLPIQQLLEAAG